MSFKFTSGSPATDYVVVKQLTGVTDLSHADAGTPTGTQWVSDSMGALQITGMTTGSNYYLLEVYDNSSGTPVRIGPAHYLELVSS
jgi:hypothetical protein